MIILLISIVISCDNFLFAPPKVCLTKNNGYTILGVMQGEGGGVVGGGGKQAVLWGICKWLISAGVDIVERLMIGVVTFGTFKKGFHSYMLPT